MYAPLAMAKVSPDGAILDCNTEWCRLLEYSRAEMKHMTWIDITPGREEQNRDAENVEAVVSGALPFYDMLKTVRTKSGTDIRVWLRAVGNYDANGDLLFFWSHYSPQVELDHTVFTRNPKTGKDVPDVAKVLAMYATSHPKVSILLLAFFFGGPSAVRWFLALFFPEAFN